MQTPPRKEICWRGKLGNIFFYIKATPLIFKFEYPSTNDKKQCRYLSTANSLQSVPLTCSDVQYGIEKNLVLDLCIGRLKPKIGDSQKPQPALQTVP